MSRAKITVVGAGNVGAACAQMAAAKGLADIVLIDVIEGFAEGKALDLAETAPIEHWPCSITGTTDWQKANNSDIVIITSGMPRKPGMSRDDLLAKNTQIVKSVSENVKTHCPDSFVIVVCNPLDAMVHAAWKTTGFDTNKVMGMAGALDSARFNCFVSQALNVSVSDISGLLMGGHGDDMVPLPRFTSVSGVPLTELLDRETIDAIIQRTRKGGIEVVNLLGYSAYYAPAAGAVKMAGAILADRKNLMCCCAYCAGQYGIENSFVGVPVIIGSKGIEKIVELELTDEEQNALTESALHVKQLTEKVDQFL